MLPFRIDPREKVAVFIDGACLYSEARHLNFTVDFKKLFARIAQQESDDPDFNLNYVVDYYYYTQRRDLYTESGFNMTPLLDWLTYNGVNVITKDKIAPDRPDDQRFFTFISEFTMDVMLSEKTVDHFIFFTNDGAYTKLFQHLRAQGKRLTLVSLFNTQQDSREQQHRRAAESLRRSVQYFIDLNELKPYIQMARDKEDRRSAA